MWVATPSSQWTFTTYSLPVSRRTHFRSGLHPPCLRFAEPVTGRHARLGSRLPARLYRGRHFRRHGFVRFQGATRTEPYVQLSCIRLPPRMIDGWPRGLPYALRRLGHRFPGPVSGTCSIGSRSPWPPPFAPPPPLPVARHCSAASLLLWRSLTSHARASSASVPHLPDADQPALQPVAGHEISQVPTRSFRT